MIEEPLQIAPEEPPGQAPIVITSKRKKDTTAAERTIADAFKKQLLLAGPLRLENREGFLSLWQKTPEKTWIHAGYEAYHGEAITLPIAGEDQTLRGILSAIKKEARTDTRRTAKKAFENLTESSLLRVLKAFNFIIYTDENGNWQQTTPDGKKAIMLRSEQLNTRGRIGRIPIKKILPAWLNFLSRRGVGKIEDITDMRRVLIEGAIQEHRVPWQVIYAIHEWIRPLHENRKRGLRGRLSPEEMQAGIDLFYAAWKEQKEEKRKKEGVRKENDLGEPHQSGDSG